MVKTLRIVLEDSEHAKFDAIKGDKTWYAVLMRGIESIEYFSTDLEWSKSLMNRIDETDGLL